MDNPIRGFAPQTSDQMITLLRMSISEQQKKERRQFIGGSDIAAVAGLDPFRSPIDIYQEKVYGAESKTGDNYHIERGNFFERPTADWWAHRTGGQLDDSHPQWKSAARPYFGCHPDFVGIYPADRGKVVLSIKVPGPRGYAGFGPDGSQEVPIPYLLQLQWELMLSPGLERGELAAPIYGDLRIYPFDADLEIFEMLTEIGDRFWKDNVQKKVPPPVDGSESYARFLQKKYPLDSGLTIAPTAEMTALANQALMERDIKELAEKNERYARNKLTELIGSSRGFVFDGGKATMVSNSPRAKLDYEAAFEEMAGTYASLGREMRSKHLVSTPGYRYLKITPKGEKNGK